MSIKKLLGTGACMVIIGVSAGASYGLFQRLTEQVATPAVAQTDVVETSPTDKTPAQFVAAGVTTWIPPEKSDISAPVVDKPAAFVQPEPPLLRYTSVETDEAASETPASPLFAHIDDTVVLDATPEISVPENVAAVPQLAVPQPQSVAREVIVASAPRAIVTPGTLRRFRETNDDRGEQDTSGNSQFDQSFPKQPALRPAQPRRPSEARATRAVQRNARFRQTWATGVYR